MSEDDLLKAVLDMARLFGLRTAHFRPARVRDEGGETRWVTAVQGDGKGYPDLTIVGLGGVLFRELKSATGRLDPEQSKWLAGLTRAAADAGVWRPEDLRSGRIEAELRDLRIPQTVRKQVPQVLTPKVRREPPAWLRADLRRRT